MYNKIWVPISHTNPDGIDPGYAWCGWETKINETTTQKWGAIWKYKHTSTYETLSGSTKPFKASNSYSSINVAARYRFTFSSGNATLDEITTGTVVKDTTSDPNHVIFEIPDVTHNPILIRFQ